MDIDFASQLLALWREYILTDYDPFHHTMTDFMMWVDKHIEEQRSGEYVKPTRTPMEEVGNLSLSQDPARWATGEPVKSGKRGVVKEPGRDTEIRREIRRLYNEGYALARIRSMLKINDWSLQSILSAAKSK